MTRKFLTPIVLPADPQVAMEAATKQYVDNRSVAPVGSIVATGYDTNYPTGFTTTVDGTFQVKQVTVSVIMSPTGPFRLRTSTSFWTAPDSGSGIGVTFDTQWLIDAAIGPRIGPVTAPTGRYATASVQVIRDFTYGQSAHYYIRNQITGMQGGVTAYAFFTTQWDAIRL